MPQADHHAVTKLTGTIFTFITSYPVYRLDLFLVSDLPTAAVCRWRSPSLAWDECIDTRGFIIAACNTVETHLLRRTCCIFCPIRCICLTGKKNKEGKNSLGEQNRKDCHSTTAGSHPSPASSPFTDGFRYPTSTSLFGKVFFSSSTGFHFLLLLDGFLAWKEGNGIMAGTLRVGGVCRSQTMPPSR